MRLEVRAARPKIAANPQRSANAEKLGDADLSRFQVAKLNSANVTVP